MPPAGTSERPLPAATDGLGTRAGCFGRLLRVLVPGDSGNDQAGPSSLLHHRGAFCFSQPPRKAYSAATTESPAMSFSLAMLWHERSRFLPGILAVAFGALLIAVQGGLLLGIFSLFALPIDRSRADVWVGYPGAPSIDLCLPIPKAWEARLAVQPEVERVESYLYGTVAWGKRGGGVEA